MKQFWSVYIENSLLSGYGTYVFENSFFRYEGEWLKGKKHGEYFCVDFSFSSIKYSSRIYNQRCFCKLILLLVIYPDLPHIFIFATMYTKWSILRKNFHLVLNIVNISTDSKLTYNYNYSPTVLQRPSDMSTDRFGTILQIQWALCVLWMFIISNKDDKTVLYSMQKPFILIVTSVHIMCTSEGWRIFISSPFLLYTRTLYFYTEEWRPHIFEVH